MHRNHFYFMLFLLSLVLGFVLLLRLGSIDGSSVPENEIIEQAKAHNLLSQLCCCLFPAQV